jgi:hypothetical protein
MRKLDCGAIPAGPARTDCFIGLSRINQQKSEIAATTARQQTDRATYRQLTGSRRAKTQRHPGGVRSLKIYRHDGRAKDRHRIGFGCAMRHRLCGFVSLLGPRSRFFPAARSNSFGELVGMVADH